MTPPSLCPPELAAPKDDHPVEAWFESRGNLGQPRLKFRRQIFSAIFFARDGLIDPQSFIRGFKG
jgi:hypothetical protein